MIDYGGGGFSKRMSAIGEHNNLDDHRALRRLWGKTTDEPGVFHPALYHTLPPYETKSTPTLVGTIATASER